MRLHRSVPTPVLRRFLECAGYRLKNQWLIIGVLKVGVVYHLNPEN